MGWKIGGGQLRNRGLFGKILLLAGGTLPDLVCPTAHPQFENVASVHCGANSHMVHQAVCAWLGRPGATAGAWSSIVVLQTRGSKSLDPCSGSWVTACMESFSPPAGCVIG